MAKISTTDTITAAQKAIWEDWAERQGKTPAELATTIVSAHIGEFAREMGIDATDDEATQLADLQRVKAKHAAKKAARLAAEAAAAKQSTPAPTV